MPYWCITSSVCPFQVGIIFVHRPNLWSPVSSWVSSHTHVLLHSTRCMFAYVNARTPERQSAQSCVSYTEFTIGFMDSIWLLSGSWPIRTQDLEMSLIRLRDLPIWLSWSGCFLNYSLMSSYHISEMLRTYPFRTTSSWEMFLTLL